MADEQTSKQDEAPKKKKKGGKFGTTFFITFGMIMALLIKTTFLFILIALLPSMAAGYADHSQNKRFYYSIVACNVSGTIPFVVEMMQGGNTSDAFTAIAGQPMVWLIVYGAAAAGWVIVWICPIFAESIMEIFQSSKVASLESQQKALVAEWGIEVMGDLHHSNRPEPAHSANKTG